jgi:omega-6 fatty acid desaturase (delta-12 desaturase)
MYRLWSYGHNKVHHGFTSLSPVDWIWRPLTAAEYRALSPWRRGIYRLERHPATCALHYLLRVWWAGMVRFTPDPKARRTRSFRWSKLGTAAFLAAFVTVAYLYAGGLVGVLAAVVVPFIVFTYFIAFFVYVHHTHPDIPFFVERRRWSATIGQVACSTVIRTSPVVEWLTHGILIHAPHHIDMRIPFYNLERAYQDLKPAFGEYVHEYRFRWSTVLGIFRQCQLYDFDQQTWHRFAELDELAPVAA